MDRTFLHGELLVLADIVQQAQGCEAAGDVETAVRFVGFLVERATALLTESEAG